MGSVSDDAIYTVVARIPAEDYWRGMHGHVMGFPPSVEQLNRVVPSAFDGLRDFRVEPNPPAAGPEYEVRFSQGALSPEAAELAGSQRLELAGCSVLAIRAE